MFGFAKKIGMTRLFIEGKHVPVTALEIKDNYVVQTKTVEKDGYSAVQVGTKPKSKATKAIAGHTKKYTDKEVDFQYISEFRDAHITDEKKVFTISDVAVNDVLKVTGKSFGKGFTGAVKRWGFHGQPASHGHDHVKAVGSIGSRWPQRVIKGKKMAGHMGDASVTLNSVKVVAVDAAKNLVFVNGSLPGSNSSYLKIRKHY